jgi:hypothetical protein
MNRWDGGGGGAYVVRNTDPLGSVEIYEANGKHVSSMSAARYHHLFSRYTAVPEETKKRLSDKGFTEELVSLVARYSGKSGVGKEKWFRNHWTVPGQLMDSLRAAFKIDTEIFASPLNVHMSTEAYCSVYERDMLFGSSGSAWEHQWTRPGGIALEFNPEYESADLSRALKWAMVSAQSTDEPFLALGVYPVWEKTAYQRLFDPPSNPYFHQIVRVPQSFFDFQTPDHWKGGESAYAHEHAKWEVKFFVVMNKAGAERAFHGREADVHKLLLDEFSKLTSTEGQEEGYYNSLALRKR